MLLFRIVGSWVRGLWLMGLGAFWLGIAYYLGQFGPLSPLPTVMGVGLLGTLTFAAGLIIFIRGIMLTSQRSPLPGGSVGWRDDGEPSASDSGFDPDAAIARYLQNRPAADAAAESEVAPVTPPRPTFGRKQS